MLSTIVHGDPASAPPLVIAHGLFGSARNWGVIAGRLSAHRQVIVADMRNHGESPWSDSHTYADMAGDLAGLIPSQADMLGHSMGGKAAMVLALLHPGKVRRLVVADIAPVAYGHTQQPLIDAMRAVDLSRVETRRDADAQLSGRVADPATRAFLLQSLDLRERRWRPNLDALAAEMPHIVGFPEIAASFGGPVLFLSGAESRYVTPEHRPGILRLFPAARFARIPSAGHWLHAENPRAFESAIATFLDA